MQRLVEVDLGRDSPVWLTAVRLYWDPRRPVSAPPVRKQDQRPCERRLQAAKREGALLLRQRLRKGSDSLHSRRSRRTTLYLKPSSSRYDTAARIRSPIT